MYTLASPCDHGAITIMNALPLLCSQQEARPSRAASFISFSCSCDLALRPRRSASSFLVRPFTCIGGGGGDEKPAPHAFA